MGDLIADKLILGAGSPEAGAKCLIVAGKLCIPIARASSGGIDPSDATALASDILAGKTAYIASGKTTGTIQELQAATWTPGTMEQVILKGKYLAGAQTILGDANLLPENIKEGVLIFGVLGTHSGGDVEVTSRVTDWVIISSGISSLGAESGSVSKGLDNIIPFSGMSKPEVQETNSAIISDQIDYAP